MSKKNATWGINIKNVYCPKCKELQPKVRRPRNFRQFLWGGYTCRNCGTEMDKYGKEIV